MQTERLEAGQQSIDELFKKLELFEVALEKQQKMLQEHNIKIKEMKDAVAKVDRGIQVDIGKNHWASFYSEITRRLPILLCVERLIRLQIYSNCKSEQNFKGPLTLRGALGGTTRVCCAAARSRTWCVARVVYLYCNNFTPNLSLRQLLRYIARSPWAADVAYYLYEFK